MDIHRIDDDGSTVNSGFIVESDIIGSQICRYIKTECNICRKETAYIYIPIDPNTMKDTGERAHGGVICDSCAAKIRNLIYPKGEE